jgi:hypothetical protein
MGISSQITSSTRLSLDDPVQKYWPSTAQFGDLLRAPLSVLLQNEMHFCGTVAMLRDMIDENLTGAIDVWGKLWHIRRSG